MPRRAPRPHTQAEPEAPAARGDNKFVRVKATRSDAADGLVALEFVAATDDAIRCDNLGFKLQSAREAGPVVAVLMPDRWLHREVRGQLEDDALSLRYSVLRGIDDRCTFDQEVPVFSLAEQRELVDNLLQTNAAVTLTIKLYVDDAPPDATLRVTGINSTDDGPSLTLQRKVAAATASLHGRDPLLAMVHDGGMLSAGPRRSFDARRKKACLSARRHGSTAVARRAAPAQVLTTIHASSKRPCRTCS